MKLEVVKTEVTAPGSASPFGRDNAPSLSVSASINLLICIVDATVTFTIWIACKQRHFVLASHGQDTTCGCQEHGIEHEMDVW